LSRERGEGKPKGLYMAKTKKAAKKDDLFERGLEVRRQVLTAEYVDKQFAKVRG